MPYDRTIRVTRPTAGRYDGDGVDAEFVAGGSELVYEGDADVQDRPRTLEIPAANGEPVTVLEAEVFLEETGVLGTEDGPVPGDFVEITGGDRVSRSGSVKATRELDDVVLVHWLE